MDTEQARLKILEKKQYAAHHMESARDAGLASRVRDMEETIAAYALADEALAEKQEKENPQPLTLEQMQGMAGEPIYIVVLADAENGIEQNRQWEILARKCPVDMDLQDVNLECGDCYATYTLGNTWVPYAQKPKEAR